MSAGSFDELLGLAGRFEEFSTLLEGNQRVIQTMEEELGAAKITDLVDRFVPVSKQEVNR